jgi:glycosyltransferase involved in cell wall biosynthesis
MNIEAIMYPKVLFITHLPSSYKVNLYDSLSHAFDRLEVIYCGCSSVIRASDFTTSSSRFASSFLSRSAFERRNPLFTLPKLLLSLVLKNPNIVVVNGWDLPEFLLALIYCRTTNKPIYVQVEGSDPCPLFTPRIAKLSERLSIFYKMLFLKSSANNFFSSHRGLYFYQSLARNASVSGAITNGVGISHFDNSQFNVYARIKDDEPLHNYSFIGISRYSPEKNLPMVIRAFATRSSLQYTHYGPGLDAFMSESERSSLPGNINLCQQVANSAIPDLLITVSCLILVSVQEAWGLIAEEANLLGVPCILSSACGYGHWSRSFGINIVIDDLDDDSIVSALDILVSSYSSIIKGSALRNVVLDKNRRQALCYSEAFC